ncbi:hypothetical protein ABZZ79_26460 [Streptomyces sp. NPDC006458]|uniref:hypothetical protein n=1 Tax=Streptomyces sp. NPDC006458 TaxID=3154302 RepID=UPI0033B0D80E
MTKKRVLVIGQLDGFANSVRPVQIRRFLQERGHEVRMADTAALSRASASARSLRGKLPALRPARMALYGTELLAALLTHRRPLGRRFLSYYLLLADHGLRRAILRRSLPLDDFDLVICETPNNSGVLTATGTRTLYDCPQPWADEMYFQGRLTERQHLKMRRREKELFERVDHLAFQWDTFVRYTVEQYGIDEGNVMRLDFGCTPSPHRARFADPPRVVYLGYLGMEFIDLPLLARLSRIHPRIDVYGGPPPPPELGLNYLGYASPDVLRNYQLGLITCSRDELMRNAVSAKHLTYLAYGLPTLAPAWRRHAERLGGTFLYTENDFASHVEAMRDERRWQQASDAAYAQARLFSWDRTLRPLQELLKDG